jgi:phosphoglycolate phosphatase
VAKVIIFDFDGTLADTYDAIVEIANRLSEEFGYQPVDRAKLSYFKQLSSTEIIKESQISVFKIPFLLKRVKQELGQEIDKLKPISGIDDCLFELKERGYSLGIITSNIKENVLAFLENNHWQTLFDYIYSGSTLFGKHKIINEFIKQYNLTPEQVIYVGDETRDIKAAKKSKIKAIAVAWGFNSTSALAEYQPDAIVEHPHELIQVIDNWKKIAQQISSER